MKIILNRPKKILSSVADWIEGTRRHIKSRNHALLYVEYGLWLSDDGGVQNYPNGVFTPSDRDKRDRRIHALKKAGKKIPISLLTFKRKVPTVLRPIKIKIKPWKS